LRHPTALGSFSAPIPFVEQRTQIRPQHGEVGFGFALS
jgi:hypothetical protein